MNRRTVLSALLIVLVAGAAWGARYRTITADSYLNKMKGGWAGQMIGVSYGAPTEFKAQGKTYDDPIKWTRESVANSINQDDVYVELSFLEALEEHGLGITYNQAGKAFAGTKFRLWHANEAGRNNCRAGIMPPVSGGSAANAHYQDIDFQIEADLFGLINPGMVKSSNAICNKFGRIMNSEDGLYGGIFVAAMYTEAFFERDMEKVVLFGMKAIPSGSLYYRTIQDVYNWYKENPNDWRKTWQMIEDKYASHPTGKCSDKPKGFNIDAHLNGAYIVVGLLYGEGDLLKTMEISCRCGQDSDCNPANAAGILCTALGYSAIPDEYTVGIPDIADKQFSYVRYTFNTLIPVCERFARENIRRSGGKIKTAGGEEVFCIPAGS